MRGRFASGATPNIAPNPIPLPPRTGFRGPERNQTPHIPVVEISEIPLLGVYVGAALIETIPLDDVKDVPELVMLTTPLLVEKV